MQRGWRDGGKVRAWQWPVRVVVSIGVYLRTLAALEDLEKRGVDPETVDPVPAR